MIGTPGVAHAKREPMRPDRESRPENTGRAGRHRRPLPLLDDYQLAWLAGLLEGEGYFGIIRSKSNGKTYRYARIGISMTDRDVVARVAALLDASVASVKPSGVSRLPQFRAVLVGQKAVTLMCAMYPLMGERRRRQIEKVLDFEKTRPDPNTARRRWSSDAARSRPRDERGRLLPGRGRDTSISETEDPNDPGMLDVVGFDTATPQLISDFARGAL